MVFVYLLRLGHGFTIIVFLVYVPVQRTYTKNNMPQTSELNATIIIVLNFLLRTTFLGGSKYSFKLQTLFVTFTLCFSGAYRKTCIKYNCHVMRLRR